MSKRYKMNHWDQEKELQITAEPLEEPYKNKKNSQKESLEYNTPIFTILLLENKWKCNEI